METGDKYLSVKKNTEPILKATKLVGIDVSASTGAEPSSGDMNTTQENVY